MREKENEKKKESERKNKQMREGENKTQNLIHSLESITHEWMVSQTDIDRQGDRQTDRLKNRQTPLLCKMKGKGTKNME